MGHNVNTSSVHEGLIDLNFAFVIPRFWGIREMWRIRICVHPGALQSGWAVTRFSLEKSTSPPTSLFNTLK